MFGKANNRVDSGVSVFGKYCVKCVCSICFVDVNVDSSALWAGRPSVQLVVEVCANDRYASGWEFAEPFI